MKKYIQLSMLMLPLISFGSATQDHPLQLPLKPNASLQKIAVSANGAFAAFTECIETPPSQSRQLSIPSPRFSDSKRETVFLSPSSLPSRMEQTWYLTLINTSDGTQIPCEITGEPYSLTFSQDGKILVVGSNPNAGLDGQRCIRLFETETGKQTVAITSQEYTSCSFYKIPTKNNCLGAAIHSCFNRLNTQLLSSDYFYYSHPRAWDDIKRTTLALVDMETGTHQVIPASSFGLCTFNPSNEQICATQASNVNTGRFKSMIEIWDLRERKQKTHSFNLSEQSRHCLSISPDGTTLCASSRDAAGKDMISLFDLRKQDLCKQFPLDAYTAPVQQSFAGETFKPTIPALSARNAYNVLVGKTAYVKACASTDETVLLYQANKGDSLCLAKRKNS